jgi:microcystin degradation protein MlrC
VSQSYRIGIGGIAIESSTFSPLRSGIDDFVILRGPAMIARYPFMPDWHFRDRTDITWLPALQAKAIPGGPVGREAYEEMKRELLDRIGHALPLDGFYLDIHGAMSVAGMTDAEADLTEAIRRLVGDTCVISAGMDLHGNVSARLVELVDVVTAYRLAPHEDVMETREKACANLLYCLDHGIRPARAWVRVPVILPGERTSTLMEPAKSLYAGLADTDRAPGIIDAALFVGYVWADEPRSSASVVVTGTEPDVVRREAEKIARRYWDHRHAFEFIAPAGSADWCIEQALARDGDAIFISDSGDNPTAGGAGDVPYFLERLLAHLPEERSERMAIYASIPDAEAVRRCVEAGRGNRVSVELGGTLDPIHGRPLPVRGVVENIVSDDPVGGDIAVLRAGGVRAIVTSRRKPFHLIHDFTALGLDPSRHKIVAVKIGYLEPELRNAARHALLALTPGAVDQDIPGLTYSNVVRPIYPLDEDFPSPDLRATLFNATA